VVSPSAGAALCDWAVDRWVPSQERAELADLLKEEGAGVVPEGTPPIRFEHVFAAGARTQFYELLKRQSISVWRDPGTTLGLLAAALYPALLVGFMFINLTGDDDVNGPLYTSTAL
jgi:hypothetical protein